MPRSKLSLPLRGPLNLALHAEGGEPASLELGGAIVDVECELFDDDDAGPRMVIRVIDDRGGTFAIGGTVAAQRSFVLALAATLDNARGDQLKGGRW